MSERATFEQIHKATEEIFDAHTWRNRITYGTCVSISPGSLAATILLRAVTIDKCSLCGAPSVRTAVFETQDMRNDRKLASEFRGLCTRHKRFGIWDLD